MDVLVFLAIYCLFQKLFIDIPFKKRIKATSTTDEAMIVREKFKRHRKLFLIIFIVAFILFYSFLMVESILNDGRNIYSEIVRSVISLSIVILISYLQLRKHNRLVGNISTFTKDKYLESTTRFSLYLRSFEKDNYSKKLSASKPYYNERFSEYWFIEALRLRKATCAVGMTKETDSPLGATRIYLDDENWKTDVLELMEKADTIYILVDDRPSCLWEIEQTSSLLHKTTFIIDDASKYRNVKDATNSFSLPDIPLDFQKQHEHFYIKYGKEGFVISLYENNIDGYSKMLDTNIGLLKRKIRMSQLKANGWKIWILSVLFSVLSMITAAISIYYFNNSITIQDSLYSANMGFIAAAIVFIGDIITLAVFSVKQFLTTVKKSID